jgi:hypothetical protein
MAHSKMKNIRTEVMGHKFHSKTEAGRFIELHDKYQKGLIFDLELQPRFAIVVNGKHICYYIADFLYKDKKNQIIVEDVKGRKTDVYKLKAKLFRACWPELRFFEVFKRKAGYISVKMD